MSAPSAGIQTWRDLEEVLLEKRERSEDRQAQRLDDIARFQPPTDAEVTAALQARGLFTREDIRRDLIARGWIL